MWRMGGMAPDQLGMQAGTQSLGVDTEVGMLSIRGRQHVGS
jgi:hypothetical protein